MTKKAEKVEVKEVENVEVLEVVEIESPEVLEIKAIIAKSDNKNSALTSLVLEKKVKDFGEAEKAWNLYGAKSKNTGFRAKFYAELRKGDLSEGESLKFAESNGGSKNDIKQISHFVSIADLVREVRADIIAKFAEEAKK